jgi:hypothetical protein
MKKRLVDPVHFFNSDGTSHLSVKHLLNKITILEAQNERLMRMLRARVERDREVNGKTRPTS